MDTSKGTVLQVVIAIIIGNGFGKGWEFLQGFLDCGSIAYEFTYEIDRI